jgi:acyl dehydratase
MSDAGLPEEILGAIGRPQYPEQGSFAIEQGYVTTLCAATEDGNPLYWDADVAAQLAGGAIAPPAALSVWLRPHHWAPGRDAPARPLRVHFDLKEKLGYATAIVVDNELVLHAPVRIGDRLSACQVLKSVGEAKQTKLGRGRFWVIEVQYRNQDDELVGTDTYTCLGYRRDAS